MIHRRCEGPAARAGLSAGNHHGRGRWPALRRGDDQRDLRRRAPGSAVRVHAFRRDGWRDHVNLAPRGPPLPWSPRPQRQREAAESIRRGLRLAQAPRRHQVARAVPDAAHEASPTGKACTPWARIRALVRRGCALGDQQTIGLHRSAVQGGLQADRETRRSGC